MQTDKVRISSSGEGTASALEETSKFAAYVGLNDKSALRLRLLTEEMLGMVNSITGDFEADFWLESTRNKVCRIHMVADTEMDYAKKKEFIKASSDKKNAASKGFMGKIQELMENGIYSLYEPGAVPMEYDNIPVMFDTWGMCDPEMASLNSCLYQWSLEKYRESIEETKASESAAEEAWDELEKSIVANIADDVRVGVRGDTVELVIEKKLD